MINWVALYPQINALAAYLAEQPEEQGYRLLQARRQLWRIGYAQRGIPVVGEFCVMHERELAGHDPEQYRAYHARLAEEEAEKGKPDGP